MKTVDCRAMSFNLSQESRKQLSMVYMLVTWGSEMSIPSGPTQAFRNNKAVRVLACTELSREVPLVKQSPYSPDLNLLDYVPTHKTGPQRGGV